VRIRRAIIVAFGLLASVAAVLLALWSNDVRQDRKHIVIANGSTPIFEGDGKGCDTRQQIARVERGAVCSVRRIRYWKDCTTIDVTLPDDRLGHIVVGAGDVSVLPPLP
jgi:hypothetical protein